MQFTPQRLEKVHRLMRREELDALIITRQQDVQYLAGYLSPQVNFPMACIVTEGAQPYLVIPDVQELVSSRESIMAKIRTYEVVSSEGWLQNRGTAFWNQITTLLRETGQAGGMIGLQYDWLSVREFDKIKSSLPEAGFKDFSEALWELRCTKDATEINNTLQAIAIGEIGIRTALEIVEAGKSEEETAFEIEAAMRRAGGQLHGIRAAVLSRDQAHLPFAQSSVGRISDKELVVLDVTVSHQGYFCEVARTIHLGHPTAKQRKLYEYVMNAISVVEKQLKHKGSVKDISEKILKKLRKGVPPGTLVQPIGNSIGLDLYEPPYLTPQSRQTLSENMIFSIHPTGYIPGVGTAKIAEVVRVSPDGCERLTTLSRETM
ncbi:MAG: M24 family metallopeptidase [Promethearchaeota archaeon]